MSFSARIDTMAEAICGSTGSGRMFPWESLSEGERDQWRQMAQAGLDALAAAGYTLMRPITAEEEAGGDW